MKTAIINYIAELRSLAVHPLCCPARARAFLAVIDDLQAIVQAEHVKSLVALKTEHAALAALKTRTKDEEEKKLSLEAEIAEAEAASQEGTQSGAEGSDAKNARSDASEKGGQAKQSTKGPSQKETQNGSSKGSDS